jgi:hypothetical protein
MDFQGRSPLKDITRSVVLGAAMVPAALLTECANNPQTPPEPHGAGSSGGAGLVATQADGGTAPPPEVVRPRQPETTDDEPDHDRMPTRGFAGAVRRARG